MDSSIRTPSILNGLNLSRAPISRPSTSHSTSASTSYPSYPNQTGTTSHSQGRQSRAGTSQSQSRRHSVSRSSHGRRSRAGSVIGGEAQQTICAVSEARGVAPTVGLAFIHITTGEAVISQICDNQFYSKTLHKIQVFEPTEILIVSTAGQPNAKSSMYSCIEEQIIGSKLVSIDRRYWSEIAGLDFIKQLAFAQDVQALTVAIGGNYFATCCFAAVLTYLEYKYEMTFAMHSLRVRYQPSEGSMLIDLSTIQSLELIQNINNPKSKDCLFGLLNETQTPMGSRLLRSNILQPSTLKEDVLDLRYDALEELTTKEEMFFGVRQALKAFQDVDKLLTRLIIRPTQPDIYFTEQSINNILILKSFLLSINNVHEALSAARSELLCSIREYCHPDKVEPTMQMIRAVINEEATYQSTPLDLKNQRTFAVKSGVNGFLDVARQTFKEATADVHQHVTDINGQHEMQAETRYDTARHYFLRVSENSFEGQSLPEVLINRYRKKGYIECQTLDLVKLNQRLEDSHQEILMSSDTLVAQLLDDLTAHTHTLFKISDSISLLDMLAAFAQLATQHDYVRPELGDSTAIKAGRHPVHEKAHKEKFIPNDVYASPQKRFQIITGCNMSGKSTYIRSIALMTVMAQIGSFVPASYASFRVTHQLFARVSMDDSIEANVSTFAAEMRETAFILRNVDKNSLVIIDELGRGTSTRDGLAIAIAIAEALVSTHAFVWFATHFHSLAQILSERAGVVNLHLMTSAPNGNTLQMHYKITGGVDNSENTYGLTVARILNFPDGLVERAEEVSRELRRVQERKKRSSAALAVARKRRLVLGLREQLKQAAEGGLEGEALRSWLERLQKEFVERMEKTEAGAVAEVGVDGEDEDEESDEADGVGDVEGNEVVEGHDELNAMVERGAERRRSAREVSTAMSNTPPPFINRKMGRAMQRASTPGTRREVQRTVVEQEQQAAESLLFMSKDEAEEEAEEDESRLFMSKDGATEEESEEHESRLFMSQVDAEEEAREDENEDEEEVSWLAVAERPL